VVRCVPASVALGIALIIPRCVLAENGSKSFDSPSAPPSTAELQLLAPGTKLNRSTRDTYREHLGPAPQRLIDLGVEIELGEYKRARLIPPFVNATRVHAGNVQLVRPYPSLTGYVAGLPFPAVQSDDPDSAVKRMFNFEAATAYDNLRIQGIWCDTGAIDLASLNVVVEKSFQIDSLTKLRFIGRLIAAPIPEIAPNKDEVQHKLHIGPIMEPFDLRGTVSVGYRYLDPHRHDDTWLYLPQHRRVKRLSTGERSEALYEQDADLDSFDGFSASIAWHTWRHLGERTILAPFHAVHFPVRWRSWRATFLPDESWEARRAWIIEAVPKLPKHAYSKRVIYLDQETFRILYAELYDQQGQLAKIWLNSHHFPAEPSVKKGDEADWQYAYLPSVTIVDLDSLHATTCSTLAPADRIGAWRINVEEDGSEERFKLPGFITGAN
jgi:hypothetical protein